MLPNPQVLCSLAGYKRRVCAQSPANQNSEILTKFLGGPNPSGIYRDPVFNSNKKCVHVCVCSWLLR